MADVHNALGEENPEEERMWWSDSDSESDSDPEEYPMDEIMRRRDSDPDPEDSPPDEIMRRRDSDSESDPDPEDNPPDEIMRRRDSDSEPDSDREDDPMDEIMRRRDSDSESDSDPEDNPLDDILWWSDSNSESDSDTEDNPLDEFEVYESRDVEWRSRLDSYHLRLVSPGEETEVNDSPLHSAAREGDIQSAEQILKSEADINVRNNIGETPLTISVLRGHLRIVELLLKLGADVNAGDNDGRTPLYFTSLHQENGMDPFTFPFGRSVNKPEKLEIAKLLLNKGANINAQTKSGLTVLQASIKKRLFSLAGLLISRKADVNLPTDKNGFTALHFSAEIGRKKLVSNLLANGADVKAKSFDGKTALHLAVEDDKVEVVKVLLDHGAEVNCRGKHDDVPLHSAKNPKTINALMEFGASVDCRDRNGQTPLHHMSSRGRHKAIATLLEFGADINIKCHRGRTPLDWVRLGQALWDDNVRDRLMKTRDVLLRHQAKMETMGLHFEKSKFIARYEGKLDEFRKGCQEEIMLLKSTFIEGTSVSYHDILAKDVTILAKYMNNENVVKASELEEYRSKFPTFASMIKRQFQKGWARNKLLQSADKVLQHLRPTALPDVCREKILDNLCDKDLEVLMDI